MKLREEHWGPRSSSCAKPPVYLRLVASRFTHTYVYVCRRGATGARYPPGTRSAPVKIRWRNQLTDLSTREMFYDVQDAPRRQD